MEAPKLNLLNDLYIHPGWTHFENHITTQIQSAQLKVKNRTTPNNEVIFARGEWNALEAILDKVATDKLNKEQSRA